MTRAWQRFWFAPQPTSTLALFRIAFGLLVTAWTASLGPDLMAFFGPEGVLPHPPARLPGEWGLLVGAGAPTVVAVWVATLVAAVALTLGLFSRVAAVVVLVGVLSFDQRNPVILNSGDGLIRVLAFYCVLAPTGAAFSLDRLRRHDLWTVPERAPWALRLVQIQVSLGYLSAVWHKVSSTEWREGTAVSYALRMLDYRRFPVPDALTRSVPLVEAMTFGTLALELAIAILVWNRAARPWVLALGAGLHLMIDYALVVGFFGAAMLTAYLAFLDPDAATRLILHARRSRPTAVDLDPAPDPGVASPTVSSR